MIGAATGGTRARRAGARRGTPATCAAVSQRRACVALGGGRCCDDAARALVVEDAAAHRDQIHDLVAELGVVRRDVAAERGVLAAERLRQAADDDVDAVVEQRRRACPTASRSSSRSRAARRARGATSATSAGTSCARPSGFVNVSANTKRVSGRSAAASAARSPSSTSVIVAPTRSRARLEERARLVVDLPHHDRVRAGREQHVGDERDRLHPAVGDERRSARARARAARAISSRRARRAVARVEVRQLRPRAVAARR